MLEKAARVCEGGTDAIVSPFEPTCAFPPGGNIPRLSKNSAARRLVSAADDKEFMDEFGSEPY